MNSHYWHFRLTFYRHTIKEMREAIQQLGMAVVVLFQVAIPAVFLFFLVGLGQLAEPNQPTINYVAWLSGYGLLIYGLIRFQRQAVLASPVAFWNSSLPVSRRDRWLIDILLCSMAGNVFLLLPIGLLLYLLIGHMPESLTATGFRQLWPLLVTCLWGIQASVIALYRQQFPLVTLVFLPASAWLVVLYTGQSWGLAILLLGPLLGLKGDWRELQSQIGLQYFWQLLLVHQGHNWQSLLLKVASLLLCCMFFATMLEQVSADTQHWVVLCCVFFSASLAATIQFSLIGFKQDYRYFLSSLPISSAGYRRQFVLFVAAFGALFLLITCLFIGFSLVATGVWSLFYVVGVWSIERYRQRFFIPLIVLFGLLSTLLAMVPKG